MATMTWEKLNNAKELTLNDLEQIALERQKNHEDRMYKSSALKFDRGTLQTPDGPVRLTTFAAKQLAHRAGVPGTVFDYLLEKFMADPLNNPEWNSLISREWDDYTGNRGEKELLIRYRTNPEPVEGQPSRVVRAVLTDRYGVADAPEVIAAMKQVLPEQLSEVKFSGLKNHMHLTDEGMSVKLLIPADMARLPAEVGPGSSMRDRHSVGLVLGNNEVGKGSLFSQIAFDKFFCTNQLRAGKGHSFRIPHLGGCNGVERILTPLMAGVAKGLEEMPKEFRTYWNTRDIRLENPEEALKGLEPLCNFGTKWVKQIVAEKLPAYVQEFGPTAYAVVNAATEFARDLEDRERALLLEQAAGRMVSLSRKLWTPYEVSAN